MQLIITIDDDEQIEDLQAVGADDLLRTFLPKAGIRAKSVRLHHVTEENRKLMHSGKEYTEYSSVAVA